RYEEEQAFDGSDATARYIEAKHIEAKGYGLRVGVTGVFGFTKHFGLEGSMAASFMQARTEGKTSEIPSTGSTLTRKANDDHLLGEIREYDFKAVWNYGRVDYFVGYEASEWDGLVGDPLPGGEACCTVSTDSGK